MAFADPQLLWLALAAPAFAAFAAFVWRRRLLADAAWAARGLWDRLLAGYRPRRLAASVALVTLAVLAVATALARPRWGTATTEVERHGVDVVFVVDTSLSMNARDVLPSRLFVAETLVRRLAQAMPNNRVALVQAEGEGQVMAPLTLDGGVVDLLLDSLAPGSLAVPGTELAPALEAALRLFDPSGREHRTLVLLSDGEDHGGNLGPVLDRLRREGVPVHALGVGTPQGAPIPLPGAPEDRGGGPAYKRDGDGDVVISHLDEEVLERVADATGGVYLRATSPGVALDPVVRRIESMETTRFESESVNTLEERFQWPLGLAAAALALYLAAGPFRFRRGPRAAGRAA